MHHKSVLIINSANMQPRQKPQRSNLSPRKILQRVRLVRQKYQRIYLTASGWTRIRWLLNTIWTFYQTKKVHFSDKCISLITALQIKSNHIMIFSPMHLMLNKKGLSNCHSIIGCINAVAFYKYAQTQIGLCLCSIKQSVNVT